jgi:TRAP-type C4-dicarboxylate transport system substrate-binding protein
MFSRILIAALLCGSFWAAPAQQVVIKMGTLAPDGSPWHKALMGIGEKWRTISGGKVRLVIYPGGAYGDEPDMVNKMRIGQIQAVGLSGAGMSGIEPAVMALQIPMMFQSYEELDYVRDRIAPRLETMIEKRGFLVLNWGDVGWVHFFTSVPALRLGDMRKLKLFTWAGDNDALELWKANGFRAVPLAATDILMGLKTGLIEAVPNPPLFALLNQTFGVARNMIDVKWAPLVGATMVTRKAWDTVPAGQRAEMLKVARDAGDELRGGIRKMGDEAIAAMQKRNLHVTHADAAVVDDWRREAESIYPKLRGKMIPADLFDEVRRLRDEFRARGKKAGK